KLLGIETVGLQAAAMRGFPPFIRVIVGLIETLGGIALLVPPAATTAAVVLAAAMVPATATQAMSGEPGTFVPITLASLVVFVARVHPPVLFALVLLFAVTEIGIYILVGILDVASPLGSHAWLQIMAGNVIAAVIMGMYFLRRHRELGEEFRHSLDWEMPEPVEQAEPASGAVVAAMAPTLATERTSPPMGTNTGLPQ